MDADNVEEVAMLAMDNFWAGFFLLLIWIPLVMLWVFAFMDLFRRDMSGWLVALWIFGLIVLPFLGVFIYWTVRPLTLTEKDREMQRRVVQDAEYAQAAHETDHLMKLEQLREKGAITQEQYEKKKAKLLKD